MDTQVIELRARILLIDELLRAGLEVAIPERDRGIDLIAYLDRSDGLNYFVARPIQLKAATCRRFEISRKYAEFPGLIVAFVWNIDSDDGPATYALSYDEALHIGEDMGWTATRSWTERGHYTTQNPSSRLHELLAPHRMNGEKWRNLVLGTDS